MSDSAVLTKEELVEHNSRLIEKWVPLLDGTEKAPLSANTPKLEKPWDRYVMARMLESTEDFLRQDEDVSTTNVFGTQYIPGVLGLIRKVYPRLGILDLVAVQPLDRPTGKVFYLDVLRSDGSRVDMAANPALETRSFEALGTDWDSYRDWASKGENEFIDKEVSLQITSQDVSTRASKMKYRYTVELQQDLQAYHGLDANAILQDAAVNELAREIDMQILSVIRSNIGAGTVTYGTRVPSSGYTFSEWRSRLGRAILNASGAIQKWRGLPPTWIIGGTDAITELMDGQMLNSYGAAPVITSTAGIQRVGTFNGMMDVLHVPYMKGNELILGRKGTDFEDASIIFLPYILLWVGDKVFDAEYQRYVRSFMSRYGSKVVSDKLLARVVVDPTSSGLS